MAIIFDEEQRESEKDKALFDMRKARVEAQNHVLQPKWEKVILIIFASICIGGAIGIQFFYGSGLFYKGKVIYREDIKQNELNLIPIEARSDYLESLPTRPTK